MQHQERGLLSASDTYTFADRIPYFDGSVESFDIFEQALLDMEINLNNRDQRPFVRSLRNKIIGPVATWMHHRLNGYNSIRDMIADIKTKWVPKRSVENLENEIIIGQLAKWEAKNKRRMENEKKRITSQQKTVTFTERVGPIQSYDSSMEILDAIRDLKLEVKQNSDKIRKMGNRGDSHDRNYNRARNYSNDRNYNRNRDYSNDRSYNRSRDYSKDRNYGRERNRSNDRSYDRGRNSSRDKYYNDRNGSRERYRSPYRKNYRPNEGRSYNNSRDSSYNRGSYSNSRDNSYDRGKPYRGRSYARNDSRPNSRENSYDRKGEAYNKQRYNSNNKESKKQNRMIKDEVESEVEAEQEN